MLMRFILCAMSLSPFYFKAVVDSDGWLVGVHNSSTAQARTGLEPIYSYALDVL